MFRNKKNAEKTDEQKADRIKGLLEKEKEKRMRIKELGIEYDFPGYQAIVDKQGGK
jgi:nucleolar protein 15